jgi:hypothetical protein
MLSPDSPAASAGPIHAAAAGIEARLQSAFPPVRFQHELLPAPMTAALMNQLASRRTPFVGLAFLGLKPAPNTSRIFNAKLRFGVYLVAQHPNSRGRMLGDRQGPGLAQMVHAAVCCLHGWTLAAGGSGGSAAGLDGAVGSIEVGDVDNTDGSEWAKDNTACAALTLDVLAGFTTSSPDILQSILATWTFDPDVNQPAPPAGDVEVATDIFERAP